MLNPDVSWSDVVAKLVGWTILLAVALSLLVTIGRDVASDAACARTAVEDRPLCSSRSGD